MKRCRYWRKRIPEAIYEELDAKTREKMERHLAVCRGCAGLYEGMAAAVRKMAARPAPDRDPEYWEGYWDRLESRMALETEASERAAAETMAGPAGRPKRSRRPFTLPVWAFGTAGAILLIAIGIFIGRTVFRPGAELPALVRTTSSEAVPGARLAPAAGEAAPLAVRASRYLKRSRLLLLAVVNANPQDEDPFRLNLPLQKRTSEELLREAVVLKAGLRSSDRRLERLVSDLELILLQIANLSADSDASDIEVIKAGVEDRDIFFKINLSEVRRPLEKSGAGPASGPWGDDRSPNRVKTAAAA